MHRLFLVSLMAISACTQEAKQPEGQMEDLQASIAAFNTAFAEGDLDVLDRMTTADYTHTNGNSPAFGKESWFDYLRNRKADLESGVLKLATYELLDQQIVFKGHSAIMTGRMVMSGTNNGESFDRQIRVSNFWVFEEGIWKRAGFHDTRIE